MPDRFRSAAAAVAVAFTVAACQTTPTAPPVVELPAPTLAQAPNFERWWTMFDDPQLVKLVDEALANNLDLAAAMARVDLARSNVLLAQADLYPSINLDVGVSRNRITEVGSQPLPSGFDPVSSNHRVGVQLSYEIDLWGKYRTQTRAAQKALWDNVRVVSEPGGAAAVAALLSGRYVPAPGERIAVLVCGANTTAVQFDGCRLGDFMPDTR